MAAHPRFWPGQVTDLHVWSIGHDIFAAEIAIVSDDPKTPEYHKSLIPPDLAITHAMVEMYGNPHH